MKKSIIISEADNIAALMENDRVVEFFVNRGELLLGDIYVAIVENILPGIDAAFVNLGKDKMGFLHANDIPGEGALRDRLVPKQKLLVQITKEPTGHKGPRVSTAISLPGRFLVLVPEERGISISRRIAESKERARLKSVVTLMKPPGVGVIIRTEAKGQNEASLFEDFEQLWDRWQTIVSEGEASIGPKLVYRDQDLLYRVIRDAYTTDVSEIIVDTLDGQKRAAEFMSGWAGRTTKVLHHSGEEPLLIARGIDKDIESVLSDRAELPSGGHLNIQPTEALTVIDVNSGRFTSSRTQAETVRKTNLEAAQEISRQLRLRNIGGMVIVDFIDMESRRDQQQVLEVFNRALEDDRAKPQVGQMSDLGLVELTRRRQGQSLRELFAERCQHCAGTGAVPTLALGSGESRRVISLPAKDEEKNAKMAGRKSLGKTSNLRAVSASGSSLQPATQDFSSTEEDFGEDVEVTEEIDVPVEILAQMPEELLEPNDFPQRGKYSRSTEPEHDEHVDLDDDGEDEDSEMQDSVPQYSKSQSEKINRIDLPMSRGGEEFNAENENFELEVPEEIESETIGVTSSYDADLSSTISDLSEVSDVEASEDEIELVIQASPLPESDFDTEVDPVTGVYRLKPKDKFEQSAAAALGEDAPDLQEPYFQETPAEEAEIAVDEEAAFVNPSYQASTYRAEAEEIDSSGQQLSIFASKEKETAGSGHEHDHHLHDHAHHHHHEEHGHEGHSKETLDSASAESENQAESGNEESESVHEVHTQTWGV